MTCVGNKALILKFFRFDDVQTRYASQVLARALTGIPELRWENFGNRNRDASKNRCKCSFQNDCDQSVDFSYDGRTIESGGQAQADPSESARGPQT